MRLEQLQVEKLAVAQRAAAVNFSELVKIRALIELDYPSVAEIYKEGISTGIATFETVVPTWEQWDKKFLDECRFVILFDQQIAGWCAISAVSSREVYKGVAETTIYISRKFQQKQLGSSLLQHLVTTSETQGFWSLQASIFPQNIPSIRLHLKSGFRHVGIREKIAQRDGIWHDNVLMERRAQDF